MAWAWAAALLCSDPGPERALAMVDFLAFAGILRIKLIVAVGFASIRLKRPSVEVLEYKERGMAVAVDFFGVEEVDISAGKMGRSGCISEAWIRRLTR